MPTASSRLQVRLHDAREPLRLGDVDRVGRLGEQRLRAEVAREHGERLVVAGKARPAVRDRTAEVLPPIRVSSPSASVTLSTSAPGSRSQMSASVFAYEIFMVT